MAKAIKWIVAGSVGAATVAGLGFAAFQIPEPESSTDWATWVQAIGSVAAIVATAGTGIWLQQRDRAFAIAARQSEKAEEYRELRLRHFMVLQSHIEETRVLLTQHVRAPNRAKEIVRKLERVHDAMRRAPLENFGDSNSARLAQMVFDWHGRLIEAVVVTDEEGRDFDKLFRATKSRIESFTRVIRRVSGAIAEGSEVPHSVKLYQTVSAEVRAEYGV